MAGSAITIALEPRRGARPEPLAAVAGKIALTLRGELGTVLRRKRDMILAAFREEYEEWGEGPEETVNLPFSGECPAIVRHVAFIALLRCRAALEEQVLPGAGYRLARASGWSPGWVEPLRAACWGSTRAARTRDLGGPFAPTGDEAAHAQEAEFGWREVRPAGEGDALPGEGDAAARHAAITGLCGCDACVSSQRSAILGDPPRRSGRESAVRRMRERLGALGGARLAGVLADLEAWTWREAPPASFEALCGELGRPAPAPLELAAMLPLVA